ncbi:PKD domain-containing protein [Urechidicola vernalis]|uniref:PKD domain-containing protein n=1 Tax=Urechidicola vernalis TaxID=3075600 RepID=A0ABU2Y4U7_9FLAO|nr:PKD domain-containing protein [Urechidicola sp. P050]MDT0553219.1 PKD domain-containing protein [Urechidicola sp. P050]
MKKFKNMKSFKLLFIAILSLALVQCDDDDDDMVMHKPLSDFQFLVEGSLVTFNGKVSDDTDSFSWDFGDGNTSAEEDPVHAYAAAGDYEVSLTAVGSGSSFTETKTVTILPSLEILLTGGPAKPEGKSWRLKAAYTAGIEGASGVENSLSIFQPSIDNLLHAVGLGASYEDTFTFIHDGRYVIDNKDGNSLMGLIYANFERGADIREVSWDPNLVPLANVLYTPATDATWSIDEEDFSVMATDPATGAPYQANFTGHQRLITGDYFGFKDANAFTIIKSIDETTMNVALSIGAVPHPDLYTFPTLMFHLSFEAM